MKDNLQLTPQQKRKLLTTAELIDKGDFAVMKKIVEFEETIDEQVEKVDSFIEKATKIVNEVKNGEDGKDADEDAIENRLHEKMMEMMPKKEEMIEEIQSKIKPTEIIIEKTEVIKEQPIFNTEITKVEVETLDEKKLEEALPKYGTAIRDGLDVLEKGNKLSIQAIEELAEILEELRRLVLQNKGGGAGLSPRAFNLKFIDDETPTGTINGSNTTFTLANSPVSTSLKVYRGGARQRVTEDYTLSGRTITFTIAPEVGEVLLCDYRII